MITLSERAAHEIKRKIEARGRGVGIRIGVKTTGCSGLAYILEYVDAPTPSDQHYRQWDANLYIDSKSLVYLDGLVIDWVCSGLNQGFEFKNPNERDRCGCGESFRV